MNWSLGKNAQPRPGFEPHFILMLYLLSYKLAWYRIFYKYHVQKWIKCIFKLTNFGQYWKLYIITTIEMNKHTTIILTYFVMPLPVVFSLSSSLWHPGAISRWCWVVTVCCVLSPFTMSSSNHITDKFLTEVFYLQEQHTLSQKELSYW